MINFHMRCGECIYFTHLSQPSKCYQILVIDIERAQSATLGLTVNGQPMQKMVCDFCTRYSLFGDDVSLNVLFSKGIGVSIAVEAMGFRMESDYMRKKRQSKKNHDSKTTIITKKSKTVNKGGQQ